MLGKKLIGIAFAALMALTASLGVCAADTNKMYLDDSADLLTQEEEAQLIQTGETLAQRLEMNLYIKTQEDGRPNREDLITEYSSLGYQQETPAMLMLMDRKNQKVMVAAVNSPLEDLSAKMVGRMEDNGKRMLAHNDYDQAVLGFFQDIEQAALKQTVTPTGKIVLVSLGVSAVITLLTVGTLTFMHPRLSRSKVSASHYLNDGKIQIYNSKDELTSSSTEVEQQEQGEHKKKA